MPGISYKTFSGEIPKLAPHLLPPNNAQLSSYCDFADGTLRPLRTGTLLQAMQSNPVKGIYTDDGVLFYTWAAETYAFKSPIIDDAFNRIYYLTPSDGHFKVTTNAGMAYDGPSPATSFNAGVPTPASAPTLVTAERTTLPDYPGAQMSATSWWDYAGTRYSETTASLTTVTALRRYTFSPPSLPGSPPAGITPTLRVQFTIKDHNNSDALLLSVIVQAGSSSRSDALPGTVEVNFNLNDGTLAVIDLVWGVTETRAYTYCYQNTWSERGHPAPPATISPTYVQDVVIGVTAGDFTGYRPFDQYVIFRTYGNNPTYIETTCSGSGTSYTDASRSPTTVGAAIESVDWRPPVTGLQGIELMDGGWFAAFKDNILYKSEVNRPHAWPYSVPFPKSIRGIKRSQSGLVVTTADGVYVVPGDSPATASFIRLDLPQPGLSPRSMVGVDGAVAYATHDGFALVEGTMGTMAASQNLFDRKTWRARFSDILNDNSMRFAFHDGWIVVTSNTTAKGFMLRLDENVGAFTRTAETIDCTFFLPVTDSLYYSVGANVYKFQDNTAQAFDWWGRDFVFPVELSLGAGYIRTSGTIDVKFYVDGTMVEERSLTTGYFRIAPIRGHRWSVRFGGTTDVQEFALATTAQDLKRMLGGN